MKSFKLKMGKEHAHKTFVLNTRGTLEKPKIPLKFFSNVHKIVQYSENFNVPSS